ncbi:FtsL-like putative cell division protein [Spongiivirga sp. MCCC 1A20706]|uniref:FtsL-like putative cell division protein n=1 Tax=Spongiivirga sp. MCCC 1A20706 TaxID=3160963 RepID=UPI0039778830
MKKGIYDILKGKFLINEDAFKNWRFILFAALLALVMIASSHSAEKKVHEIARLSAEVKELRSEYIDLHKTLMVLKMESQIAKHMVYREVFPSKTPPKKIKVKKE